MQRLSRVAEPVTSVADLFISTKDDPPLLIDEGRLVAESGTRRVEIVVEELSSGHFVHTRSALIHNAHPGKARTTNVRGVNLTLPERGGE